MSAPDVRPPRAPRRRRAVWIGGGLLVGLVATALLVRRSRRAPSDASPRPTAMADMPGMSSMPGMTAPPGDGGVRLTGEQVRQFGVTFGTVEARTLSTPVRATGVVTVDEGRVTTVAPRYAGYVERLFVRTTGAPVSRGQPLAAIYAPDVLAAEEELLVARRLAGAHGLPLGDALLEHDARRRRAQRHGARRATAREHRADLGVAHAEQQEPPARGGH